MNNKYFENIFQSAGKMPLHAELNHHCYETLDRTAVENILPQRDFLLLIDRISYIDRDKNMITAHYELKNASDVFSGHFPGLPMWPGIMQVEAVLQVANILHWAKQVYENHQTFSPLELNAINQARFISPITPKDDVEIQVCLFGNDRFYTAIGQCNHQGKISSAMWLQLI